MKKRLCMFLCILISAALCVFAASAETVTGECGFDVEFVLDTETGEMTIWGYGNIDNSNGWVNYDDTITSVAIENGVTGIEEGTFSFLSSLTTVTIADSVTWIGDYAFSECDSLTEIVIPDSVMHIGEYAFDGTPGLENTVDGVVYIKTKDNPYFLIDDLSKWSITALNVPSSTRFITEYALQLLSLTYVAEINVAEDNPRYMSVDGILFDKNKTQLICYPSQKTGASYVVPESVTSLGNVAFMGCRELENITLSDNLISIGDSAFHDSGIKSIAIPKNVATLDGGAFSECQELSEILVAEDNMFFADYDGILYSKDKSILIRLPQNHSATAFSVPDGVVKIGDSAFGYCAKLTNVQIPQSVVSIEDYAFADCSSLKSIIIPDGVTEIGRGAFRDCIGISEFVIPSGISIIDSFTFGGCKNLERITIPESVTEIDIFAFENCEKLDGIILPQGLAKIGNSAFRNCKSLTKITIPGGVNRIAVSAFENCTSLKDVEICEGVKSINPFAFCDCSNLSNVSAPQSVNTISATAFAGCSDNLTIRCYKDSKAASLAETIGINTVFIDEVAEIQGDIDGDGEVSVYDVVVSLKALLNHLELDGADMDGDGKITLIDVMRILKSVIE